MLSTRLENQEGRDRLSVWRYMCIKKQAVTTRWRMEYKILEIHWNLDPKNWRNEEDNDLNNQKHRGILTSVQQLKLEELHLFGIAFYFLNLFSYTKTSRD